MARFPKREGDIEVLASRLIEGLTENADVFVSPPVTPEELTDAFEKYRAARKAADRVAGEAKTATDHKDEFLDDLVDRMKDDLKYAEIVAGDNDGKLNELGWGGRSSANKLDVPSRPRDLEVVRSGKGWVFLDWKFPTEGGEAAAYKVQCSRPEEGEWKDVGACVETQLLVNKQERGVDLQFHVIALNRAGESEPSNIIRVTL